MAFPLSAIIGLWLLSLASSAWQRGSQFGAMLLVSAALLLVAAGVYIDMPLWQEIFKAMQK